MIRPATVDDAEQIAHVHVRSWQDAYAHVFPAERLSKLSVEERAGLWRRWLPDERLATFVAETDGRVVGFVNVGPNPDDVDGELFSIYVDPDSWGTGVGRSLIERGEAWLRAHGYDEAILWVLDDNPRARRFYEAAGWSFDGGTRTGEHLGVSTLEVRYRKRLQT